MNNPNDTIRVVIPLAMRRRNGRPRILPPEDVDAWQGRAQDPHILKALGRAWAWRRKLESGEMATASDIAMVEKITERFVSRTVRLSYVSPGLLEQLVVKQKPLAIPLAELIDATSMPWARQPERLSFEPD